jgi:hypothetical protein
MGCDRRPVSIGEAPDVVRRHRLILACHQPPATSHQPPASMRQSVDDVVDAEFVGLVGVGDRTQAEA